MTEKTDHKAEALRLARQYADAADREASTLNIAAAHSFAAASSAYSNLLIAEGQERVAEAVGSLGAPASPKGVAIADLARWILDALERPADDPSNTEASLMQARIDTAIRGWFDTEPYTLAQVETAFGRASDSQGDQERCRGKLPKGHLIEAGPSGATYSTPCYDCPDCNPAPTQVEGDGDGSWYFDAPPEEGNEEIESLLRDLDTTLARLTPEQRRYYQECEDSVLRARGFTPPSRAEQPEGGDEEDIDRFVDEGLERPTPETTTVTARLVPAMKDKAVAVPSRRGDYLKVSDYPKIEKAIRSQERQRVREALLSDEEIRALTKEIVEGSDGEVISLPYAVVEDALRERLAALDSLEDGDE